MRGGGGQSGLEKRERSEIFSFGCKVVIVVGEVGIGVKAPTHYHACMRIHA